MTLSEIKKGQVCRIDKLPDETIKTRCICFGIYEGESIKCIEKLFGGQVILEKGQQEIAIGYKLAKRIEIKLT